MKSITTDSINHWTYEQLVKWGVSEEIAAYANLLTLLTCTALLVYLIAFLSNKFLTRVLRRFAARTTTKFDDFLIQNRMVVYVARIVPLIIVINAIPVIFADFKQWIGPVSTLADIYVVFLIIWLVRGLLRTSKDFLKTTPNFKDKPVESYVQVLVILLYFAGALIIFSLVTGKSVGAFLTAMGAASAILMLIFKDTILGFVASIQVSTNDMVRIGDWITMDKYGADGDVIEINLTTVKIQNFDKTITTIPTYYLISDSFKNWRAMQDSGGRRIKRSIFIKISSIRYLSQEDVEKLKRVQLITAYLEAKTTELHTYNTENEVDQSLLINGRHLTNIGVFRKYIDAYIAAHSFTNKEMTMMVRQLAPSTSGIPIELYVFTNDVRWINYEKIMADIFDHLLAAVNYFDLEVFEMPGADDVRRLNSEAESKRQKIGGTDEAI